MTELKMCPLIMIKRLFSCVMVFVLTGCSSEAYNVRHNIQQEADNFNVRRKVIAINTRTNDALFTVEGYLSISVDADGDLNVTIQTGPKDYKLFYAHLSDTVTYTCLQLDSTETTPFQYEIAYFPPKEVLLHGVIDLKEADNKVDDFNSTAKDGIEHE